MMEKTPHQVSVEKFNPQWDVFLEAKIIKCSGDYWYKDMIGKKIKVKNFYTFGIFDEENRFLLYYDVKMLQFLKFN